jgi:hypothetical protein
MIFEALQSLSISLMRRETDPDSNSKAEYVKIITAKFIVPDNFSRTEEDLETVISNMYIDLLENAPEDFDSIGMWVQYDNITIDNALSSSTLDDIKEYSKIEVNPIWEMFKMTIQNYDDCYRAN